MAVPVAYSSECLWCTVLSGRCCTVLHSAAQCWSVVVHVHVVNMLGCLCMLCAAAIRHRQAVLMRLLQCYCVLHVHPATCMMIRHVSDCSACHILRRAPRQQLRRWAGPTHARQQLSRSRASKLQQSQQTEHVTGIC